MTEKTAQQMTKKLRKGTVKKLNPWVSSLRVVVENSIGGMKKVRILEDKTRGFYLKKSDQVARIAAGLHNLRVTRRKTTYPRTLDRMRM